MQLDSPAGALMVSGAAATDIKMLNAHDALKLRVRGFSWTFTMCGMNENTTRAIEQTSFKHFVTSQIL